MNLFFARLVCRAGSSPSSGLATDMAGYAVSRWIKTSLVRVSQFVDGPDYPTHQAAMSKRHILLSRRITETEWLRALTALDELEMEEGWQQEFDGAAYYYRPDFENRETPFQDIRDFSIPAFD